LKKSFDGFGIGFWNIYIYTYSEPVKEINPSKTKTKQNKIISNEPSSGKFYF